MAKKLDPIIDSAPATALTPADEANLNAKLDIARKVDAAANEMAAAKLHAMRLLGQVEALSAVNKYTGVGFTLVMKEIKESGGYKDLPVPLSDGSTKICANFDDFCASLNKSASKVYEDIQNLNVLGEDFMRASEQIGLSYRQLRSLRRLPEETRQALTAAELPNDADELKELVEDALIKQAETEAQLKEAKLNEEAKNKVLDKKNKALDRAQEELVRLKNIPPKEAARIQGEKEQAALKELHADGLELIGALVKYLAKGQGMLEDDDCGFAVKKLTHDITSGLCSTIAQSLIDAGFDIDFKVLVYPQAITDAMFTPVAPEADTLTDGVSGGSRVKQGSRAKTASADFASVTDAEAEKEA